MATTTTHYNLKKYEGADLFNPLTYENLNADAIDQAMFDNKQQAIGPATELVAGTVHALTRGNADSPIFAFTATSNYAEGDTFTVDGTPVTALTTSGETLPGGAYVIGSEVICYLRSTQLTVFIYKKTDLSTIEGQITALESDVQDLEQEVLASVTADGVDTYETIFNGLYSLVSAQVTSDNFSHVKLINVSPSGSTSVYQPQALASNRISFQSGDANETFVSRISIVLMSSGSVLAAANVNTNGTVFNNLSAAAPAIGNVFKVVLH